MLSRLLTLLFRHKIKSEFPARLNLFLLFYSVEKIIYLLIGIGAYYIFMKIGLSLNTFILTVAVVCTMYLGILAIFIGINYYHFCRSKNGFINPYDYMLIMLATNIELKRLKCDRFTFRLQRDKYIDMKEAIRKAATDLIRYNRQLKKTLNIIVIYYCSIFYILFLAYDFVYFKVTDITFHRFWQAASWMFPSLGHIMH